MVKAYKDGMSRSYQYSNAGTYKIKIAGNLSSAVFSGEYNNGLVNALVKVDKLDEHIEFLGENAFANCKILSAIDFDGSNVKELGICAFNNCQKLNEIRYCSSLQTIGQKAFANCASLMLVAPIGFDKDISDIELYESPSLENLDDNIFENSQKINCLVFPGTVDVPGILNSKILSEMKNLQHIVFIGMNADNEKQYISEIEETNMLGLNADCTFEDGENNTVYKFSNNNRTVEVQQDITTYFNLTVENLPETFSGIQGRHIYTYGQQAVDYLMANSKPFIVLYFDSKTSALTKKFLLTDNINTVFSSNAPTAPVFVLDRYGRNTATGDISHFKQSILVKIAAQQKLFNPSTDAITPLDFPEANLISAGGMRFQKLSLGNLSLDAMNTKVAAAVSNIFN